MDPQIDWTGRLKFRTSYSLSTYDLDRSGATAEAKERLRAGFGDQKYLFFGSAQEVEKFLQTRLLPEEQARYRNVLHKLARSDWADVTLPFSYLPLLGDLALRWAALALLSNDKLDLGVFVLVQVAISVVVLILNGMRSGAIKREIRKALPEDEDRTALFSSEPSTGRTVTLWLVWLSMAYLCFAFLSGWWGLGFWTTAGTYLLSLVCLAAYSIHMLFVLDESIGPLPPSEKPEVVDLMGATESVGAAPSEPDEEGAGAVAVPETSTAVVKATEVAAPGVTAPRVKGPERNVAMRSVAGAFADPGSGTGVDEAIAGIVEDAVAAATDELEDDGKPDGQVTEAAIDQNDLEITKLEVQTTSMARRVDAYALESTLFGALAFSGFLTLVTSSPSSIDDIRALVADLMAFLTVTLPISEALERFRTLESLRALVAIETLFCSLAFILVIVSRLRFMDHLQKVEQPIRHGRVLNTKEEEVFHLILERRAGVGRPISDGDLALLEKRLRRLHRRVAGRIRESRRLSEEFAAILNWMRRLRLVGILAFLLVLNTSAFWISWILGIAFVSLAALAYFKTTLDEFERRRKIKNLEKAKRRRNRGEGQDQPRSTS